MTARLPAAAREGRSSVELDVSGLVVAYGMGTLLGGLVSAGIGLSLGERPEAVDWNFAGWSIVGGALLNGVGGLCLRKANLFTDNLGVNALGYLAPGLSLMWLALFVQIGVARIDYLAVGLAVIVAANLVISFEERLLRWTRRRLGREV